MIGMIRRVFWMSLGAAAGVSGYRKVARLVRAFSPAPAQETARSWPVLPPPGTARPTQAPWHAPLLRAARATAAFARDVRDGMRIYRLSDSGEAPTLRRHQAARDWAVTQAFADGECPDEVKDGR
jgi:hypothetical protein